MPGNNLNYFRPLAGTFLAACISLVCACSGANKSAPQAASQGTRDLPAADSSSTQTSGATREAPMSGAIHLPVLLLEGAVSEAALKAKPEALAVTAGGPDDLPEGPAGFEVMSDGRLLVADPLRNRIAIYDASGTYKGEWQVGFPVGSIAQAGSDLFRLRSLDSDSERFFDSQGHEQTAPPSGSGAPQLTARLNGPNGGTMEGRQTGGPLTISFENGTMRLISIQPLGSAPNGAVYVALEATPGGDTISVRKQVREYAANGRQVAEVSDIPLTYDFPPTDELKVRRGVLYQLAPGKAEIRINRWSLD